MFLHKVNKLLIHRYKLKKKFLLEIIYFQLNNWTNLESEDWTFTTDRFLVLRQKVKKNFLIMKIWKILLNLENCADQNFQTMPHIQIFSNCIFWRLYETIYRKSIEYRIKFFLWNF